MTPVETAAVTLDEALRTKLESAPAPLKFKDVAKGLPRPRKVTAAALEPEVRRLLDEEVRLGRAFACPSGKKGEMRYWARDEKHLLREKALELAASPLALAALKTKLGKVTGADGAFAEPLLRELIGEGRLHEHAPAKRGAALFGATPPAPPPPWWEQAKHQKKLEALTRSGRQLLAAAGGSIDDLLHALRGRLLAPPPAPAERKVAEAAPVEVSEPVPVPAAAAPAEPPQGLADLILKAVANAPVVSLAELREEMPAEYRGRAFDEAVLRLADEQRVIISQDDNPERFTEAERDRFVSDGRFVFTTIAQWS